MNWHSVNRISMFAGVVLLLVAFLDVLLVVTTGWERDLTDEGAAAHAFQLLITIEVPVVVAFLASADWRRIARVMRILAIQGAAICLALGSVAFFHL